MASIRERHTFIVHSQFRDADNLSITAEKVELRDVPGTRQDRFIVSPGLLKEQDILRSVSSVRVEIVSKENYAHITPFNRQVAWGTHVHVAPAEGFSWDDFCRFVTSAVSSETECLGERSFIELPFGYYLHSPHTDSATLLSYLSSAYGALEAASELESANYISLSYSRNSTDNKTKDKLVAEAYWYYGNWHKTLLAGDADRRVEVGLLGKIGDDPEGDLTYGGILAVVGTNEQFVPTLFDFSPRHRSVYQPAVYHPDFRKPYGLHPKHLTTVLGDIQTPRQKMKVISVDEDTGELESSEAATTCSLYAYYVLPSFVFVDQYQISDLADAQASGVKRVVGIFGETDLEIPVWMVNKWGSVMLLELLPPPPPAFPGMLQHLDVEIPMHFRYETPDWNKTHVDHEMPWPALFWACNGSAEADMTTSPFDSNGLGHEHFFGPGTMFYYLHPNQTVSNPVNTTYLTTSLSIPVVPLEAYKYVQPWTVVVICFGCLWIIYKTFLGYVRDGGVVNPGVAPTKAKLETKGPKAE